MTLRAIVLHWGVQRVTTLLKSQSRRGMSERGGTNGNGGGGLVTEQHTADYDEQWHTRNVTTVYNL